MDNREIKFKVAVATSDGIVINQHFGRADKFKIYEINTDNIIRFAEERNVVPVCQAGNHDETKMSETSRYLSDCKYVLVSKIGQGAINALEQEGVTPMELPGIIDESISRLIAYHEVQT